MCQHVEGNSCLVKSKQITDWLVNSNFLLEGVNASEIGDHQYLTRIDKQKVFKKGFIFIILHLYQQSNIKTIQNCEHITN